MTVRLRIALVAVVLLAAGLAMLGHSAVEAATRYRVSASVQPSTVLVGHHVSVTGKVSPQASRQVVKLQLSSEAGWRTVAVAKLGARSRFVMTYTPPAAGTYQLRVRKPAAGDHRRGTSATVTVTVTPSLPPM